MGYSSAILGAHCFFPVLVGFGLRMLVERWQTSQEEKVRRQGT